MKKLFVCVAVLGLVAASASAEPVNTNDRSLAPMYTATAAPIDAGQARAPTPGIGIPYKNLAGTSFSAVSGTGGAVAIDDYNLAIGASASWELNQFRFIGGVANAGEVLFFTFFTPGFAFNDSFGVQFPQGGNFQWTITISTPSAHLVHNGDFVRMWADDGSVLTLSTGTWFMSTDAPTAGTTGNTYPGFQTTGGADLNAKFQLIVPEPATLAMFGMGVLTLVVRRRR